MPYDLVIEFELILRVFVAAMCGMLIGYERHNRHKVAGIKTHMTVGLASALLMVVSKFGFYDSGSYDASRVAAQIVSGVGFLGAGIIFKKNQSVHGLTTAAGIWTTSGVGMAIGAGLYFIGIASTLSFVGLHFIVYFYQSNVTKTGIQENYRITFVTSNDNPKVVSEVCQNYKILNYCVFKELGKTVLDLSIVFSNDNQKEEWTLLVLTQQEVVTLENY